MNILPDILAKTQDGILSLDTEYVSLDPRPEPPRGITETRIEPWGRLGKNQHLSYQLVGMTNAKRAKRFLTPEQRYTLDGLILEWLDMLGLPESWLRPQGKNEVLKRLLTVWHWGSAEMGMLVDRKKLMTHIPEDDKHKAITQIGGALVTLCDYEHTIRLSDGIHYGKVLLTIMDTQRLSDEKSSLESLGDVLDYPKIQLPPGYSKSKMDVFKREQPKLFEEYAMRDAEVSLKYLLQIAETNQSVHQLQKMYPTTGSTSAAGLKVYLNSEESKALHNGKGYTELFCLEYNHGDGYRPMKMRANFEGFPTQSFMGGANQSYRLGQVRGTIFDLDLSGAYGAAMGCIPSIIWEERPTTHHTDPWDLTDPMCFALIRFRFPQDTMYPNLPVPTKNGLVYPLACEDKGGVSATGPEIHEALLLGADIEVLQACKFVTGPPLLAGFVGRLTALRTQYPKSNPMNRSAKLGINSLFGKTAQGLQMRYTNEDIFTDEELNQERLMPRSAITLPHVASTITGHIRAVLLVLVNEGSKLGTVVSATTDGFMMDYPGQPLSGPVRDGSPNLVPPMPLIEACQRHPSVQLLMQGRKNLGLDPTKWLEVKYAGDECYTVKTRMNWLGWQGETVHQAMVGLKGDYVDFSEVREIRENRLTRYFTDSSLNKADDLISHDGKKAVGEDITSYFSSSIINTSPDWKRKFAPDGTSLPYKDMREWARYRYQVDKLNTENTIGAWPDQVIPTKERPSKSKEVIRRGVLHRIALKREGYRTTMSDRMVCSLLGVNKLALARLRQERLPYTAWDDEHPEVARLKGLLQLTAGESG